MKQQSKKKMSSHEQQQHINPTNKIQEIVHDHSSSTFPEAIDLSDEDGHVQQHKVAKSSLLRPSSECKKLIIIWLLSIAVVMVLISVKKQHTTLQQILMDGEVELNKSLPLESNELSNNKIKSDKTQTELNSMSMMQANKQEKITLASQLNKPLSILKIDKTQQQLKNIIKQMKNPNYRTIMNKNFGKSTRLQDEVYFAFQLSRQPSNQEYLQAQYYYYNQKYNLSALQTEVPICAVMVGRNLGGKYSKMIESVMRQNYSNFHLAFVDDNSDDGTKQNIQNYIKFNKDLQQRTTFIWQHKQMHALYNRNAAIRDICRKGDIIMDLDSDDWLIGNQVFQIVNSIYQNSDIWACYFNNIVYSKPCRCPLMNVDTIIPLQVLKQNKYRTSKYWRTTELRTFRKDLYDKIDQKDFVDQKGQFYEKKSDAFIQFPIVELAGPNHIKFLDEFLYFYESTFSKSSSIKTFCRLTAKAGTPYLPLKSLNDTATKMSNYEPPQDIRDSLNKIRIQLGYN